MNQEQAEQEIEKNFLLYYLYAATTIFITIMFIGIFTATLILPQYKTIIMAIAISASTLFSIIVPLNADWYWQRILSQKMKTQH